MESTGGVLDSAWEDFYRADGRCGALKEKQNRPS